MKSDEEFAANHEGENPLDADPIANYVNDDLISLEMNYWTME